MSKTSKKENRSDLARIVEKDRLVTMAWMSKELVGQLKAPLRILHERMEVLINQLEHYKKDNAQAGLDQILQIERTLASMESFFEKPTDRVEPTCLYEIVEGFQIFFQLRLATAKIHVMNLIPPDLSLSVSPKDLQHIFLSLLMNAIEALEEHEADSKNIIFHGQTLQDKVIFSIEDDGPGFNLEITQIPLSSSKKGHIGLGLAVCRKLAQKSGWQLNIKSKIGKGTQVDVIIPKTNPLHLQDS